MPGFPTRTGRAAFGPDPLNARPVRDPRRQLDGETIGRLMFWQLGAVGLVAPQAFVTATVSGTTIATAQHSEAFQPRGGAGPALGYTSTGVYTVTYSATYPDETGAAMPLVLRGGIAVAQGASALHGQVQMGGDGHSATVRFWSLGGAAADPASLLVLLW